MRPLLVLIALAGPARADIAVDFMAQGTRSVNQPARTLGASVELSIDRPQWQYFTELGIGAVSFGDEYIEGATGTMFRGGIGMRYLARRFSIARMDWDLGFEAVAAMQEIEWGDGNREWRPELSGGFAWSFGFFQKIAFRTSMRVFFAPTPTSEVVCRGPCPSQEIKSGI